MIYDRMIRLMPSGSQDGIYDISYKMYRCAVGAISVLFLVRLLKYDKYMPQSYLRFYESEYLHVHRWTVMDRV